MAEKIIIDAGHNGLSDPGAVYDGRRESDDVLNLAMAVGDILASNGFDVDYTRTGNVNQTVNQKAQYANQSGADLFISLHRNKASYPNQYDGVQTLIFDESGFKPQMAENINQNLENVGFKNISVETRPDLVVLRRTEMPALLVEVGFIDSDKDNEIFDNQFQEVAQAIADGIMETLDAQMIRQYAYQAPADSQRSMMPMSRPNNSNMNMPNPSPMQPQMPPQMPQDPPQPSQRPLYRVQVGAFYNMQNAIALEQELKQMGYNTWIVTT